MTRLALAGLLIPASAVAAQQQQAQQPSAQSTGAGTPNTASNSAPNTPTASTILQTTTNLVLVDVVVTVRGRAVRGLSQQQFHVFENGREQAITAFDEHEPAATPAVAAMPAPLPPHVFSNIPVYPEASAVNVLLLDALNTPTANQMEVRNQMLDYLAKIEPGSTLAIFTLASHLQLMTGFTTDVAQLTTTLKNPQATHTSVAEADQQTVSDQLASAANAASIQGGATTAAHLRQFATDLNANQTDQRVLVTLEALQGLARYLSAIPGRKNLIWFSGSFPISLDPSGSGKNSFRGMSDYEDQIRLTSQLLSAARVAVYPVDARGLISQPSFDANYAGPDGPGGRASRSDNQFIQETDAEEGSMEKIAEQTGGQAYVGTNGLKEAVAKAVENGATYYTIGYVPEAKDLNGQFRKLQVRVDHSEYKLAYRDGYYADPQTKASSHNPGAVSLMMSAILHGAPPSTQILFKARVLESTDPLLKDAKLPETPAGEMAATLKAPVHRFVVDLNVDPHTLSFADLPDGRHQAQAEFVLLAYDSEGKRLNYLDRSLGVSLKPDKFASTMANGIRLRLALDLPAGPAYLRIAVHDLTTDSTGSLEIPIAVTAN
jgi:VWFA-related protein